MTKFSIVLPCYNIVKYLKRCLDSLFENGYQKGIEVILVNDGSTDNFKDFVSKYFGVDCSASVVEVAHGCNEVVVVNQENMGLSDARNSGLTRATGEYLLFLDPDDYFAEGYFERLENELEKHSVDMLISGYVKMVEDDNGAVIEEKQLQPMKKYDYSSNSEIIENLFMSYFGISVNDLKNGKGSFLPQKEHGTVCRICYRMTFLKENGLAFDSGLKTNEDRLFNSRCLAHAQSVYSIDEAYYHYTVRNSGLFRSRGGKDMIKLKLQSLQIRADIVKHLQNLGYETGLEVYAGSNVLSVIELMNNKNITYKEVKKYRDHPDVIRSVKMVPFIKNIKFDVSLLILKCRMTWLLFAMVRILKKFGLSM